MPRQGNGIFQLVYDWEDDRDNGIKIRADRMMGQEDDIGNEITNSIAADGQTVLVNPIPFNNNRITLLASGIISTDAATLGQIQGSIGQYSSASGTNAYAVSMSPTVTSTAVADGFSVTVFVTNANTSAATATLNVDGTGAFNIVKNSGALIEPGDIPPTSLARFTYKGGVFYYNPARVVNYQTGYASASGTNSYAAVVSPPINNYVDGMTFRINIGIANTSAATAQLALNGLTSIPFAKNGGTLLSPNDLPAGAVQTVTYRNGRFHINGTTPALAFGLQAGSTFTTSGTAAAGTFNYVNCTSTIVNVGFPAAMSTGDTFGFAKFGVFPMSMNPSGNNLNGSSGVFFLPDEQTFFVTYTGAARGLV